MAADKGTANFHEWLFLRIGLVDACLRSLVGMRGAISVRQRRAELCECRETHGLVRMFDFACVEYIVEDRGETAQSPECLRIEFHFNYASRLAILTS